ncbi:uncharacterized protein K452DRAFT_310423 [Aplosporella prunicola CBS 121167]|uniref:CCHC-type domain-containing protein n=1 Tax=Aplosporella prunicola CBS 121167 TaxID=1176127 RepID=A0A6A6BA26_9PEZI|nr:uncharacterized protein K452DRAFT_310423 [Aplosporella prunicola CBS 121167]KAF2140084.1 hypothetical protein K452DRAFT_310423 [Aplosporella prunicola CBS 121167]
MFIAWPKTALRLIPRRKFATVRLGLTIEPQKNMSSLSRRACYKCGNVGHYAGMCLALRGMRKLTTFRGLLLVRETLLQLQATRYVRRPLLDPSLTIPGHESNGCPHPRTTETKQCYHCQGLGHVQADCPTLRLSGAGTSGRCYSCGQPGHLARSCPTPGAAGIGRAPIPRPYGGFRGGFAGGPRPATCYKLRP